MTYKDAIFSPVEATNAGIQELKNIEERAKNGDDGIRIPIAGLRDYFAPMMRGQYCTILGQTSHGKSFLMQQIMHGIAKDLSLHGRSNSAIIHVSTEDLIEEQMTEEIARESKTDIRNLTSGKGVDWDKVFGTVNTLYSIPIYRIGDSLERQDIASNLYLRNIVGMIGDLRDGKVYTQKIDIAAIFVDYLQALPYDPEIRGMQGEEKRRLQVRNDVYEVRKLSKIAPVFLGAQAKQDLKGTMSNTMRTPGRYDGSETAAIGERTDRMLTVDMPKNNFPVGSTQSYNGKMYVVEENLQFVKVEKQRGKLPAGKIFVNMLDYGDVTNSSMTEF